MFICGILNLSAVLEIFLLSRRFICDFQNLSALLHFYLRYANIQPHSKPAALLTACFSQAKSKSALLLAAKPHSSFPTKKSAASAALPSSYILFSISAQAASLPRPVSDEKTINGSFLSISSVWRTTFLCFSHLPFGILSAFVAMMMHGIS